MVRAAAGRGAFRIAATLILSVPSAAWAQSATPAPAPSGAQGQSMLDPNSPLAPLPDLGVAWPDLSQPETTAKPADEARNPMAEARYDYRIDGLDGVDAPLLKSRFDDLSALRENQHSPANLAQIDRRARQDSELLTELLRAAGYYDAQVTSDVERNGQKPVAVLQADPGTRYRFSLVTVSGLDKTGAHEADLRKTFGLKAGDPVDADAIADAVKRLSTAISNEGFPFAKVGKPQLVVDHAMDQARLDLAVVPGGDRVFGKIVTPDTRVFGAHHVQEIARFKSGQPYDANEVDDLRRALIQTGLVSSVKITPVEGSTPDTVDLRVAMTPAPPRTIAGELGYGTGEGARAEISWTHRNLLKPEGALTLRGVLGTREQLGSVIFRRNNFHGRDRVLTSQISAAHTQRTAYDANTFQLSTTLERQTNIFFQKKWTWSLGAELLASDERDVIASTGQPRRRTYFIGALPTSLDYDGSDDLLNPTRGFRLGARVSPELSLIGKAFGYARVQFDASAYQPVSKTVVLAQRVRLGSILGAPRDAIAPSRRFYAGGGASVRGYGYQDIGPRDPNNDPIGGRSLAEFSIEARVKAFGNFGVVPFLDAGNIYTSTLPKFTGFRFGTGLGVRYYSSFGPIRVDVGTPINPQPGDPRIAVYVSLGQAF
ncbi:autotransporter assembly complex family protein [Stakelama sediminis]|uniref:Translocation and assembly module subunit TamA n=1 Tax=Stakelama sediminis TaxID=463200 RepID=A0A840Z0M1_9SPHN|nr:autotransporter assembly complex family protein [Stakelama sediminis]MBB5719528.1 translocation and assembly module TamA [Stakelama sediminis]